MADSIVQRFVVWEVLKQVHDRTNDNKQQLTCVHVFILYVMFKDDNDSIKNYSYATEATSKVQFHLCHESKFRDPKK